MALARGNRSKDKQTSGLDDGHGDRGEGLLGDSMMFDGNDEPGWLEIHRVIPHTLGMPGEWAPVSDVEPPAEHAGNATFASLRWMDRVILNMLDKVGPLG